VGAALAIAKDTSGVRSGGGADKASIAAPKAFESGAYGGAGEGHRMARPRTELTHLWERASERSSGRKGCDRAGGVDKIGPAERDRERV